MKLAWIDVRDLTDDRAAVIEEAVHQRIDGILSDRVEDLVGLPPTITSVLVATGGQVPDDLDGVSVLITPEGAGADVESSDDVLVGRYVEIVDAETLELACQSARHEIWSVLDFRDPTKIPLEIVLAAASTATGSIMTVVHDLPEAEVVFGVLEHGSEGVVLKPSGVGDATKLKAAAEGHSRDLDLAELTVVGIEHVGMGERACVDTVTHFREDEGIMVGSHSKGMILCCSETHPLPYMPTRPFRVNAGALHSYTLSAEGRTHYLSELTSGSKVMAVDSSGRTRLVAVGRVKIETRPLLSITARAEDGTMVDLIVQDDWHVRVLGPGGEVLNVTELTPGTKLLGVLPVEDRHVGYPIDEFCIEK